VDGKCSKLVTVIGHQFITLTVDICVQHGGRDTLRRAGLSAAADTYFAKYCIMKHMFFTLIYLTDPILYALRTRKHYKSLIPKTISNLNDRHFHQGSL